MPQMQLPIFPEEITLITPSLGFQKKDGKVIYFNGHLPVFQHEESDTRSFQMITSQFVVNGCVKQADIIRAFGVTAISVKRSVKKYQAEGTAGFYAKRKCRGAGVLTPGVVSEVQGMLDEGLSPKEIAIKTGMKRDTLEKAVRSGRLHQCVKKKRPNHL